MRTLTSRIEVSWRAMFAGSLASLVLHGAVLLLVSLTLRGCQQASSGEVGGERFRAVGLFVTDGAEGGLNDAGRAPGSGATDLSNPVQQQAHEDHNVRASNVRGTSDRVPAEAPDVSRIFNVGEPDSSNRNGSSSSQLPPLIGAGTPIGGLQRTVQGGGASRDRPSEAGGAPRIGGTGGPGETTFMEVAGVGKTFVYVIDSSSSMHGGRLKIAQSQLKASLRLLQPNQKFAVIFYNQYRNRLTLLRQLEQEMYFATDLNKKLATEAIDRETAGNGTEHKPAILEALELKPDVVYFLTDGDEPELSAGDLTEIRRAAGSTTIHVIKFGDGTMPSRATTWLELLARQAGGEFRTIQARN